MSKAQVLNYGGGTQTAAMCVLVCEGILPRPDRIVIADTGREVQSTWDYLNEHMQPYLGIHGLKVEIAPRSLASVDLYSHQGTMLMPIYTETGKFTAYCSGEWKRTVVQRYLRSIGITSATSWIGFAMDESRRIKGYGKKPWKTRYPLTELMLTTHNCKAIIGKAGFPLPKKSRCLMCPHQWNSEWRELRDQSPDEFEKACKIDEQIREDDSEGAIYLHSSRIPLRDAEIDGPDPITHGPQCGLGTCFF